MKIIKVSNKGFKVSGEERLIRKAMNDLLTNNNKYNNKSHIEIIKEIMAIIENEENIYRIVSAENKKDILNLII